jgi:hypothetical protein
MKILIRGMDNFKEAQIFMSILLTAPLIRKTLTQGC